MDLTKIVRCSPSRWGAESSIVGAVVHSRLAAVGLAQKEGALDDAARMRALADDFFPLPDDGLDHWLRRAEPAALNGTG